MSENWLIESYNRDEIKKLNEVLNIEINSEICNDNISNIIALEKKTNSSEETRKLTQKYYMNKLLW